MLRLSLQTHGQPSLLLHAHAQLLPDAVTAPVSGTHKHLRTFMKTTLRSHSPIAAHLAQLALLSRQVPGCSGPLLE